MLVPWSFMFNKSFQGLPRRLRRRAWIVFDFFSEFGYDILDNATVGTVGTVVRSETESAVRPTSETKQTGTFIRLHDVSKAEKSKVPRIVFRRVRIGGPTTVSA